MGCTLVFRKIREDEFKRKGTIGEMRTSTMTSLLTAVGLMLLCSL